MAARILRTYSINKLGEAVITKIRDFRSENINWIDLGKRFKKVRKAYCMSCLEAAREIDIPESIIMKLENGVYTSRKSTNVIWSISFRWNLSLNWLLNGLGQPHDPDPLDLIPETLHVQKGAGIRREYTRSESEEGRYADHVLEFVMAVDKFKNQNKVPFPALTQIYEIIIALGYRKSVPSRIAPLGYIIEHQQWAEKLKLMSEKIEISRTDRDYRRTKTAAERAALLRKAKTSSPARMRAC